MNHFLITPEDLARINKLQLDREDDPEVAWLCKTARHLARIKPTECDFPERVHLIHPFPQLAAFPMRYAEKVLVEQAFNYKSSYFIHILTCQKTDAFLLVRPYVRLESPEDQRFLELMEREGRYDLRTDGETLSKGPLADILVGRDGYGIRRKPIALKMPEAKSESVFRCGSDEDPMGAVQVAGVDLGVFVTNQTQVMVELHVPGLSDSAKISIGLVVARYTSKGIVTPVLKV
jgi:hypothetical protein